jgi:hypothetical protein
VASKPTGDITTASPGGGDISPYDTLFNESLAVFMP